MMYNDEYLRKNILDSRYIKKYSKKPYLYRLEIVTEGTIVKAYINSKGFEEEKEFLAKDGQIYKVTGMIGETFLVTAEQLKLEYVTFNGNIIDNKYIELIKENENRFILNKSQELENLKEINAIHFRNLDLWIQKEFFKRVEQINGFLIWDPNNEINKKNVSVMTLKELVNKYNKI